MSETNETNPGRLRLLLSALNEGLYEKEQAVALALLSAVAGESLFLLGPPGVAKSMIARRLKEAFAGASSFEYLMSRFSTPDEIFGPVSISKLKDEDRYERVTDGYLPSADIVFLDEIWKAGPGIQNALLTVLNEKVYRNGRQLIRLPLKGLIAASNELPAEGEGLEALWDRFLLRCVVTDISRNDLFDRMITDTAPSVPGVPEELKLTARELEVWRWGMDRIVVPEILLAFIHRMRDELIRGDSVDAVSATEEVFRVSDRRWKKAVNVLRASAFLNGRSEVRLSDAMLLAHVLWDAPDRREALLRLLSRALVQTIEETCRVQLLQDRMAALRDELRSQVRSEAPETKGMKVVHSFYYQLITGHSSRNIFMYASEYKQLDKNRPTPFVLVTDRYKTGGQVLKKYEKSRYPSVFPKDILQVVARPCAVVVNGKEYPLLTEKTTDELPDAEPLGLVDEQWLEVMKRLAEEIKESKARLQTFKEQETDCAAGHLFLDEGLRNRVEDALRAASFSLNRIENELNELQYACGNSR